MFTANLPRPTHMLVWFSIVSLKLRGDVDTQQAPSKYLLLPVCCRIPWDLRLSSDPSARKKKNSRANVCFPDLGFLTSWQDQVYWHETYAIENTGTPTFQCLAL